MPDTLTPAESQIYDDKERFITVAQVKTLIKKFEQNHAGCQSFETFLDTVEYVYSGDEMQYIALPNWCGMYIGIEKDGYAHS